MKIITLLAILFVGYVLYMLIKSQQNMEKELREMRIKCTNGNDITIPTTFSPSPATYLNKSFNMVQSSLVSGLSKMYSQ